MTTIGDNPANGEAARRQRDRFVAFSFAATDFVFEIDVRGVITFASGAARELTGRGLGELIGLRWLELFDGRDQAKLAHIVSTIDAAGRSGPVAARLTAPADDAAPAGSDRDPARAVFSACRLPNRDDSIYCTLSTAAVAPWLQEPDRPQDEETGLLDSKGFSTLARDTLETSMMLDKPIDLTLLNLAGGPLGADLDKDGRNGFLADLGSVLRARAVGGELAGRLSDSRFGVVHDRSVEGAVIEADVRGLIRPLVADGEAISLDRDTLCLETEDLGQEEAAEALVYAIDRFAVAEPGVAIHSLRDGFKGLSQETRSKVDWLKSIIAERRFGFDLQPVVDLKSRRVQYYELSIRFEKGRSPYPWISFAENVGLSRDLDLAVFSRAIEFLRKEAADPRVKVAVSLSGKSLSNAAFVKELTRLLTAHRALGGCLMIELAEAAEIADLVEANAIVQRLRAVGFSVGLDDLGVGTAPFQYLQALDVEFVKLDGLCMRSGPESERARLTLKAIVRLCHDLGMRTVGEAIETEEQAARLVFLGVMLGQGDLLGRPASPADYGILPPARSSKTVRPAGFGRQRFNPFTGAEILHRWA